MDPSLIDGYRVIYDREVPFELRLQDGVSKPMEVGTLEAIRVKIMIQGANDDPSAIKIELMSENDLYFH